MGEGEEKFSRTGERKEKCSRGVNSVVDMKARAFSEWKKGTNCVFVVCSE